MRNCVTDFFKSGEVPEVGKIAALLRLDRLHGAIVALEKYTGAIRLVLQHEPLSIGSQLEKSLDEFELGDALERHEPGDLFLSQPHLSRPPAAGGATLAFIENRHDGG